MTELFPLRCTGCGRQFGWATAARTGRAVYCARWCETEPVMLYNNEEQRNQLWEALDQVKVPHERIAQLWGVGRTTVNKEILRRRAERHQAAA